jgi:hypothetical protein
MKKDIETLEVTANQSKKTFTIRKFINGKLFAKYRTIQTSKSEFEQDENNTEKDWKYFLRSDPNYYTVKIYYN